MSTDLRTPGVYREEVFPKPADELRTGVPAFLGFTDAGTLNTPQQLSHWSQFEEEFGTPLDNGYLASAVHGFFENRGLLCYVVRLDDANTTSAEQALDDGLKAVEPLDSIDLICVPDIMQYPETVEMQSTVLKHCDDLGDRFAILDSLPDANVDTVLEQRQGLKGTNGAIYFPWLDTGERDGDGKVKYMPPSGHVAGVYARSDEQIGVHKAPANEVLEGVLDLKSNVTGAQQDNLNPEGVNCLRAFPGRGIRVWGARTLSEDSAWTYVNVRRLFLTAGRWIERNMSGVAFEPNDSSLWARIERELTTYFNDLFTQGALKGSTAQEAFYVKCDDETNTSEVREAGQVVTEIGLAPAVPGEFVIVRITSGASGVTVAGPT